MDEFCCIAQYCPVSLRPFSLSMLQTGVTLQQAAVWAYFGSDVSILSLASAACRVLCPASRGSVQSPPCTLLPCCLCFKVQSAAAALRAAPAHHPSLCVSIFIFSFLVFLLLVLDVHTSIFKQTLPRSSLPPNPTEEEE